MDAPTAIERRLTRSRAWKAANKERNALYQKGYQAEYRRTHVETKKAGRVIAKLGLTREVALALYSLDCAICGESPHSGRGKRSNAIDHDHSVTGPGAVRGVLCLTCNVALGRFESGSPYNGYCNNPNWVACAEQYLSAYLEVQV